jgi:single-strand DNA-binding protein
MPNGGSVTTIRLATSESFKDKQGERQEHTEWHRISFFGKLGEIVAEYSRKGTLMWVEGRLRTRKWEKDGVDQYSTEVVGDRMQLLGGRPGESAAGGTSAKDYQQRRERPAPGPAPAAAGRGQRGGSAFDDMDDDIPF